MSSTVRPGGHLKLAWPRPSPSGGSGSTFSTRRVGVVGLGYWGPNLARCFHQLGALAALCDRDEARLLEIGRQYHTDIRQFSSFSDMLDTVEAVAIATEPDSHYHLAKEALEAGKSVFVEKPLTTLVLDAEKLYAIAQRRGLALATGHIYLHCYGIQAMPVPIGPAELSVSLLNPGGGPSPSTQDMTWAGLPHAISLACHFFRWPPDSIKTFRMHHQEIRLSLEYWNGSRAWIEVADYTGVKQRQVGLRVGNTHWLFSGFAPNMAVAASGTLSKHYDGGLIEPLLAECQAFLAQQGPDDMGLRVVRIIEDLKHRWEIAHGR